MPTSVCDTTRLILPLRAYQKETIGPIPVINVSTILNDRSIDSCQAHV